MTPIIIPDLNIVPQLIPAAQVALRLGVTNHRLRVWRRTKTGPPWVRLSTQLVRYPLADLERWILERRSDYRPPR